MAEVKSTDWFKKADMKTTFGWLKSTYNGLSNESVQQRIKEFGFNEVAEKKKNVLMEFLMHFWGPIPWLLEIAALLAFLIGDTNDALLIAGLVILNTSIEFYNEHDSQKALELLKKKLTLKTNTLRNGKWAVLEARELVPGDIITVGLGEVVPADAKIIEGNLSVDQSALTGESLPVELKESDIIFTGSTIKRGKAKCVVVNTGMKTYFGKTVELVNIAKPKSKQEEIMFRVSRNLIYAGAIGFFIILCYAIGTDVSMVTIATFAVLFIGGGVPAALPVMFTISQSKGATELSKQNILVTKLDSIENAASVEILCLDKTGTLTLNELEVSEIVPNKGFEKNEVIAIAALASDAEGKDAIDNTVINYAEKNKVPLSIYVKSSYVPFEPSTKRSESIVSLKGKKFKAIKGATQVVMSLCKSLTAAQKKEITKQIDTLSQKGCRVLGIAKSDCGKYDKLEFAGLLALSDPLRPDSKQTIAALKESGVKPIMLTGDNIAVATEIATQVGIGTRIIRISEIKAMPEKEQAKAIQNYDGIAEIYPEDKYWVVKLLQSTGKMVGMTGDGVNDAPALKQAELGIAVSTSTDVAKAAANMVITEPGTNVILEAVKTSRRAYQRMLTWTLKKIARSIQFMIVLTLGFFWLNDIIVSVSGLMLLVVVNDFLTMSLAVDNARSTKNPNTWEVKNITIASIFLGIYLCAVVIGILVYAVRNYTLDLEGLRTLTLIALVYTGQLGLFVVRERGHFWASKPMWFVSFTIIFSVVIFTLMALFGILIAPIPSSLVWITLGVCTLFIILMDFPKVYIFKKLGISC